MITHAAAILNSRVVLCSDCKHHCANDVPGRIQSDADVCFSILFRLNMAKIRVLNDLASNDLSTSRVRYNSFADISLINLSCAFGLISASHT